MFYLGEKRIFRFGKHKDACVEEVTYRDPKYIVWCRKNEICDITDDELKYAKQVIKKRKNLNC